MTHVLQPGVAPAEAPSAHAERRPRGAVLMSPPSLRGHILGPVAAELDALVELSDGVITTLDDAALTGLADVEVLVTGWGSPLLSAEHLDAMPRLRLVLHAGGTVRAVVDPGLLAERGIAASNAGEINAIPVAEYTVAMILLAGKRTWQSERLYRERRAFIDRERELLDSGNFERTVGLVGASRIGRKVIELLRVTRLRVLLHDPYVTPAEAADLGVELVPLLELAERSDVLSVHAPATPETHGMIDAEVIARLRPGATFLNTARGALVDQDALVDRVRKGDLEAILDVTSPDPLPADDPLWDLPNVVLTPHVAGAMGSELTSLGRFVVDELSRWRAGEPLHFGEL